MLQRVGHRAEAPANSLAGHDGEGNVSPFAACGARARWQLSDIAMDPRQSDGPDSLTSTRRRAGAIASMPQQASSADTD